MQSAVPISPLMQRRKMASSAGARVMAPRPVVGCRNNCGIGRGCGAKTIGKLPLLRLSCWSCRRLARHGTRRANVPHMARYVPAALLAAVSVVQIVLAATLHLSAWKGGGFGMFSTLDHGGIPWRRRGGGRAGPVRTGGDCGIAADAKRPGRSRFPSTGCSVTSRQGSRRGSSATSGRSRASRSRSGAPTSIARRCAGLSARCAPLSMTCRASTRHGDGPPWTAPRCAPASPGRRLWRSRTRRLRRAGRRRARGSGGRIDNPHFDTALRLTAIALLLRPMGPWFVRPAILAAAVLVLIFPRALRQWQVWGALARADGHSHRRRLAARRQPHLSPRLLAVRGVAGAAIDATPPRRSPTQAAR